ncbi:MAG TPA: FAD-binding oxidoreductase [Xanthomonadales bacterium]|nr:FAD-binding oxidoreductase [Xanthomonadales bacterium]
MGSLKDLGHPFGVWGETAPPCPALAKFSGAQTVDIAIVGAGYTGLSAALHLAKVGARCAVLEAFEPGWGESGRNTGWMEPNWWMKDPALIRARFGAERGNELTQIVASGPALLSRWIAEYGLAIEWDPCGLVMATADSRQALKLAQESRDWQSLGIDHPYLDESAMGRYVAGSYFKGGLWLKGGATLNPLALSRELCRAAIEAGAQVHVHSPVRSIKQNKGLWELTSDGGTLTCRTLLLATGVSTGTLWPRIASAQAEWHAAVIASDPYDALDDLLPAGSAVADLNFTNILTLRRAAGNRLVTSVLAPALPNGDAGSVAVPFMRKFRRLFPHFPEPRWRYLHYGKIGLSRDMLPRLCQLGPNAWTAFGYSGTGINYAVLFGRFLAELALSDGHAETAWPVEPLAPYPLRRTVGAALRYLHAPVSRNILSRL